MPGGSPRPVLYLLPAGHTRRRDDRLPCFGADGRKQPELADVHGEFVVLRLEAEGTGHTAAPRVNLDDVGARDAAQQGHGRGRAGEGLLVTVAVEQDAAPAEAMVLRQDEPAGGNRLDEQFFREARRGRYRPRPRVVREKSEVFVAER